MQEPQSRSVLKSLIGEQCTIYLNNGEEVSGTFWDYSSDAITVKVKKGLLYSNAEQFSIDEIKRLEGPSGQTYDLAALLGSQSQSAKRSAPEAAESSDNILRILTIKDDAPEQTEESAAEKTAPAPRQSEATPSSAATKATAPADVQEKANKKDVSAKAPVASKPAESPRKTPPPETKRSRSTTARSQTPANPQPEPKSSVAESLPREEVQASETLRYQTLVLSIAAGVMIVLFIIFKGLGLNSLILAKYSMFPTRLIRMNAPYGIIDQGKEDGVKMDDIVRLYRKNQGKIEYKGTVKVTKVAQNYSAIETIRTKKDSKLGAGDVGVRDRNILLYALKQVRTAVGAALGALARMLAVTARTLSVDHADPLIERKPRVVQADHESDIKEVTELIKKSKTAENADDAAHKSDVSSEHIKR